MASRTNKYQKPVEVITSRGPLKGYPYKYIDGEKSFLGFKHIPYAHIPTGELRFAPPKKIISWKKSDVLRSARKLDYGEENRLILNIFTPEIKKEPDQNRPVIVFVAGDLSSTEYVSLDYHGPRYLIEQDVVVVNVSYRTGVLGFLKINNPRANAPGDVGLRDLKLAFAWIREEIENFGGCPNNITAYGQGLGATHIRLILMSANFENSFDKAILSSCIEHEIGEPVMKGGMFVGQEIANKVKEYFPRIYNDLIEHDLSCAEFLRRVKYVHLQYVCSLLVATHTKTAIDENKVKSLCSQTYRTRIPVIIGYNSDECVNSLCIGNHYIDDSKKISYLNKLLVRHGGEELDGQNLNEETRNRLYDLWNPYKIFKLAGGQLPKAYETKIASDLLYNIAIFAIAKKLAYWMKPQSTYLYRYDINLIDLGQGAGYGDELQYIFSRPHVKSVEITHEKDLVIKRMTRFWAQFARTGNPNPPQMDNIDEEWLPIGYKMKYCLNIMRKESNYIQIPETQRMRKYEARFKVNFFSAAKKKV